MTECNYKKEEKTKEPFYKGVWRPAAAIVYLLICVFDFVIMPTVIERQNKKLDPTVIISQSLRFTTPASRETALKVLYDKREWEPKTLQGGGMFHIAFGALLGAAAWTRGMEKVQEKKTDNL